MLMSMFQNEPGCGTVIQTLHDLYIEQPGAFNASMLLARLVRIIDLPDAAVLLADIAPALEPAARERAIALLFAQNVLCIERVDAIFRICQQCNITLPPNLLERLAAELASNKDQEVLACIEAILRQHSAFFATDAGQARLLEGLGRPPQYAVFASRICVNCCSGCPVAQPLMQAVGSFATQFERGMDADLHATVAAFLAAHK